MRTLFVSCVGALALALALCAVPSSAQSTNAAVGGQITDEQGRVVPGVTVLLTNLNTGVPYEAKTNGDGFYNAPNLPPGIYRANVTKDGFKNIVKGDIELHVQDVASINFELQVGSVSETVTVEAGGLVINTTDGSVSTVVDRQFVENIPLNGRSFQSLITLTPGVVTVPDPNGISGGQFSVNGQRASANGFMIDGVSANFAAQPGSYGSPSTGGNLPGLTVLGTTQSLVSVDALQEFKVQTSTYSAEYGRQPGGQISIITRSGTNQFHGSAFDYLRNDVFDANDWFADRAKQPKPKERENDFGGTLGGPVVIPGLYNGHNRTFFFFSYEGLRLGQPQFNLTNVPTLTLRQTAPAGMQPILNAFPLPNGKDLGNGLAEFNASYSDPSSLDATSVRIDHTLTSELTLFARYNKAPSQANQRRGFFGEGDSFFQVGSMDTHTYTIGATALLTPHISNEVRVNYSGNGAYFTYFADNFGGATPLPRSALIPPQFDIGTPQNDLRLQFTGLTSISAPRIAIGGPRATDQRQWNIVDGLSYAVGSHQLEFGVDYRRLNPVGRLNQRGFSANFLSQQSVLAATADNGFTFAQIAESPVFLNFSAYGQDTWRVSRRLRLNLGLRWDINPAPSEANGNLPAALTEINNLATMQLAPLSAKEYKTTYNNFAPRLGAAYQVSQASGRETVVRGGFGVFYDTGTDVAAPFNGTFPYASFKNLSNIVFPLSSSLAQIAPDPLPIQTGLKPPYATIIAFDPALKLPYTLQWNVAMEQSIGKSQAVTVSYVGAAGRRLLQSTQLSLSAINPSFTTVQLTRNSATSDYDALQAQFQRRLSRGLQALASYTWSHALDNDSESRTNRVALRGNAAFDVRHVLAAAVTYDIPAPGNNPVARGVLRHWSIDMNFHAQSALPVDLIARTQTNPADGSLVNVRPNVNPGVPFYVDDPSFGRRINPAAFSLPAAGQSGNFGRNQVRGLGAWQIDTAVRREFPIYENMKLQFRAEAFNLFNHPNFGTIQTTLTSPIFGQPTNMLGRQLGGLNALYQIGGPRSFQFALKIIF